MRSGVLGILSVTALTLVAVAADDGPAVRVPTPPRTIDFADWTRVLDGVRASDRTEAGKVEFLRHQAAGAVLVRRAKLVEARPVERGGFEMTFCDVFGGPWRDVLVVPEEDKPAAVSWRKWDRVRLQYAATVRTSDDVVYRLLTARAGDLARSPNPGLEYPPDAAPLATRDAWLATLRQVGDSVVKKDWPQAYERLERLAAREHAIPGRIATTTKYGTTVQPEMNVAWETRDGSFRIGPPRGAVSVLVPDPQLAEALVADTPVTLSLAVTLPKSPRALQEAGGNLEFRWRLWRVAAERTVTK